MVIFENAGEIRVAGARLGHRNRLVPILRRRGHLFGPVLPIPILDAKGDWRPERLPPTNARANLNFVLLDQHPPAAAVALLAAPEIVIDLLHIYRKSRRHPIDDRRQAGPMGLPRGEITQHGPILLYSSTSAKEGGRRGRVDRLTLRSG